MNPVLIEEIETILAEVEESRDREWEKLLGCSFSDMKLMAVSSQTQNEFLFLREQFEQQRVKGETASYRQEFSALLSRASLSREVKNTLRELFPRYPVLLTLGLRRLLEIEAENSLPVQTNNLVEIFVRPRLRNLIADLSFFIQNNHIQVVQFFPAEFENKDSFFNLNVIQLNHEMVYFEVEGIVLFNQVDLEYFWSIVNKEAASKFFRRES